jgi:hypothetical protein
MINKDFLIQVLLALAIFFSALACVVLIQNSLGDEDQPDPPVAGEFQEEFDPEFFIVESPEGQSYNCILVRDQSDIGLWCERSIRSGSN